MAEQRNGLEAALDELLKGKKTEEIVGPRGDLLWAHGGRLLLLVGLNTLK